jgi:hypothetical protein
MGEEKGAKPTDLQVIHQGRQEGIQGVLRLMRGAQVEHWYWGLSTRGNTYPVRPPVCVVRHIAPFLGAKTHISFK